MNIILVAFFVITAVAPSLAIAATPADTGTLIFSDTFDAQADYIAGRNDRCTTGSETECADVPTGWTHTYTGERWHPDEMPGKMPSLTIGPTPDGGAGKSMVIWDESYGGVSQWGSGAQLAKELAQGYSEIYVEYKLKWQSGFRWQQTEAGKGQGVAKVMRIVRFNGGASDSRFSFFSDGFTSPVALQDAKSLTADWAPGNQGRLTSVTRCSPSATNYKCGDYNTDNDAVLPGDPVPTFLELMGDGEWHTVGMRAKMPSAKGVADGEIDMYFDGALIQERRAIPFIASNGTEGGWNMIQIGGNLQNVPELEAVEFEQWWAIDDVYIYSLDGGSEPTPTSVDYTVPSTQWTIVHQGLRVLCSYGDTCMFPINQVYSVLRLGWPIDRNYLACVAAGCTEFSNRPDAMASLP